MTTATQNIILLICGPFGRWSGGQLLFQDRHPYVTLAPPAEKFLSFFQSFKTQPLVLDTASGTVTEISIYRWKQVRVNRTVFTEQLSAAGFSQIVSTHNRQDIIAVHRTL
jgi:hypothetical protein